MLILLHRPLSLTHGMYSNMYHKSHVQDKITYVGHVGQEKCFPPPTWPGYDSEVNKGLYKNVSMWLSTFYDSKSR